MKTFTNRVARWVLLVEPLLLALNIAAFWFPDPRRVWALLLLIPVLAARLIVYRRAWTWSQLSLYLTLFVLFMLVNVWIAPGTWGVYVLGRPILGFLLIFAFVEHARRSGQTRTLVLVTLLVALLIGVLGLGASQWTIKSVTLDPLTSLMPKITFFPGAEGGFNVNEIGGALTYFAPFAAGIACYEWRTRSTSARRWIATAAFLLITFGLFLGQSRMAIFGMIAATACLIFLLIPRGRWRTVAVIALVAFTALELVIVSKILEPDAVELANRDEASAAGRLEVYRAAIQIVIDHPFTGVGMNRFRAVRAAYPVVGWDNRVLPHAHNELLQVGTDLGIPGAMLYIAIHVVFVGMLWRTWRASDEWGKTVTAAAGAALLAHTIFGLADAITMWDRFSFVMWWFFGLGAAQYWLAGQKLTG